MIHSKFSVFVHSFHFMCTIILYILLAYLLIPLFSRSVTQEEREAKYVRMLTSSLLGVKRLLSLLLQEDRVALEQTLADLVSSGKFWKYSKHKTPQVLKLSTVSPQ